MSRRRPIRLWRGVPPPVDPTELLGPRGLTAEVVEGDEAEEGSNSNSNAASNTNAVPTSTSTRPERVLGQNPSTFTSTKATDPSDANATSSAEAEDDAFWKSLLTPSRLARIESVVAARLSSVTAVLDSLVDPHNVAAILRTAEGLGLARAHFVPSVDDDAVVHRRITQDADKWIDVVRHDSGALAARALRAQGYEVYAGDLDESAVLLHDLPADRPVALLFGHEHEGPSKETLAACTGRFRIPMAGFTQSFNVSVAAAIALSHQTRARRDQLGAAGDLPAAERQALLTRFYKLAAKLSRRVPDAAEIARRK